MLSHPVGICSRCRVLGQRLFLQSSRARGRPALAKLPMRRADFSSYTRKLQTARPKDYKPTAQAVLPERLLIYNAGMPKTMMVTVIKTTTLFLFGATCLIQLPYAYAGEAQPNWANLAIAFTLGASPLVIYAYLSGPFVNSVFLKLPTFARRSRDLCYRYAAHLPPDATFEIVTLRLLPWAKTTGVRLSELRLVDKSKKPWWDLRLPNMYRVKPKVEGEDWEKRLGWKERIFRNRQREFWYDESKAAGKETKVPGIWETVLKQIQRNSARD